MVPVSEPGPAAFPDAAGPSAFTELEREVSRRRTFAIISHPDAGKTTLTEKLLLYAGAIELAGAVRGRHARRHATSDWMELEQERGISITSAALEFELQGRRMSLLDTPGHNDFSEDTYRALIAADSVVMVIDAANGVEDQTRKLFEVCRRHRLPILTFVNKFDRPARDPLALLDDIERTLGIAAAPVNWPIGSAERFRGVYDIQRQTLHRYEREAQGQYRAPVELSSLDDPDAREMIGAEQFAHFRESLDVIREAGEPFDVEAYLRGTADAGVLRQRVDELRPRAVPSGARRSGAATAAAPERCRDHRPHRRTLHRFRVQDPGEHGSAPSGPRRVCPRLFRPLHEGHGGVQQPAGEVAQGVARVPVLWPRPRDDQRGLRGRHHRPRQPGAVRDRRHAPLRRARAVSRSAALSGGALRPHPPAGPRYKQFDEGVRQLEEEGLMQVFYVAAGRREPIVGVVGALQYDVIASRLRTEYGVVVDIEPAGYTAARWLGNSTGPTPLPGGQSVVAVDRQERRVLLFALGMGAAVLPAPSSRRALAGRVADARLAFFRST